MRYALLVGMTLGLLPCCSSIERKTELAFSAPPGQTLTAGPGDTVLDFKATKSLPNAFGKADLFGRTTDAGRIVVRYVGTENGNAIFVRSDLIVESNKTTMTETPLITSNTSNTYINGSSGGRPDRERRRRLPMVLSGRVPRRLSRPPRRRSRSRSSRARR